MGTGTVGILKRIPLPRTGASSLLVIALTLVGLSPGALIAAAGEHAAGSRPKIGLALSGGGARGAAHIGVIRVLEEMRIPVDYIAGTSMGSIVGGLYASGMTPDEIEEALLNVDWKLAFRDRPSREDLSFRRKEDGDDFPISLQLGYRDGSLRMPRGLLQGQNLASILASLTLPVVLINNFDELSIPFRAVAADIATGEKVVLGGGSLSTAMRASMSIPGVFAPMELDGRLLVDGGIASNLPVDVVREMGAELVIAIDISTPLLGKENLQSALPITMQVTTILTRSNTEQQISRLAGRDILIVPALGELSSGDFSQAGAAVPIGEAAAREAAARLSVLSLPEEDYRTRLLSRGRPDDKPPVIDFVRVKSDSDLSPEVVTSRLHVREGELLDLKKVKEDVDVVYGLGLFERVDASVVREDDRTGLVVETIGKSWGPNYINFGLSLESDIDGGSSFNFRTRLTVTEINKWGAEWRTDLQLGEEPHLTTEFYQPLGAYSSYFVAPRLELEEFTALLYIDDEAVSNYRVGRKAIGLDLGRHFGTWGEMRLGILLERASADVQTGGLALLDEHGALPDGLSSLEDQGFDSRAYRLSFAYDTFDSVNFPRRGTKGIGALHVSREHLGADESFESLAGQLTSMHTWGYNTVGLGGKAGTILGGEAPIQDTFPLGGFLNLSGMGRGQMRGQHLLLGRLVAYRQVAGRGAAPPSLPVYLGFSLEAGNVWQDTDDISFDSFIPAGSAFIGLDSLLGPVYIGYGYAEEGRSAWYFYLGRGF
jgi:NTE family protein